MKSSYASVIPKYVEMTTSKTINNPSQAWRVIILYQIKLLNYIARASLFYFASYQWFLRFLFFHLTIFFFQFFDCYELLEIKKINELTYKYIELMNAEIPLILVWQAISSLNF